MGISSDVALHWLYILCACTNTNMYWTHMQTLNREWTAEVACMMGVCVCVGIPCMLISSSISWCYNAPKIPGLYMVCICVRVCVHVCIRSGQIILSEENTRKPFKCIDQGWWTYGTCPKRHTRDFLGMRHSLLFHAFLFLLPNQPLYTVKHVVYIHIWLCTDCICITVASK